MLSDFSQLPVLASEGLIPEVNGLMIDKDGNLVTREQDNDYIVSFTCFRKRITARITGGRGEQVRMELGCRLVQLPYSAQGKEKRKKILALAERVQLYYKYNLSVTPKQWLYVSDGLVFDPDKITASWMVTKLSLAAFCLKPAIDLFDEDDD